MFSERGTSRRNAIHSPADPTVLPMRSPQTAPARLHVTSHHHTSATVSTALAAPTAKIARGRSMLASAFEAGTPIAVARLAKASTATTGPCPS